jgi:ribonuclease P protein component
MCGRQQSVNHAAPPLAPPARVAAFGLPRERRLKPPGYRATFDSNDTRAGRYFVMWLRKTEETQGQLGVVATKRILPHAVDRNRARRLLRETYRLNRPNLIPGIDLILLARRPIREARQADVAAEFRKICRQARIGKEPV